MSNVSNVVIGVMNHNKQKSAFSYIQNLKGVTKTHLLTPKGLTVPKNNNLWKISDAKEHHPKNSTFSEVLIPISSDLFDPNHKSSKNMTTIIEEQFKKFAEEQYCENGAMVEFGIVKTEDFLKKEKAKHFPLVRQLYEKNVENKADYFIIGILNTRKPHATNPKQYFGDKNKDIALKHDTFLKFYRSFSNEMNV